MSSPTPLRIPLLASLFLAFAFGVTGLALAVEALEKSDDEKAQVKAVAPSGTTVDVNFSDILDAGIAVTVACGITALLSLLSMLALLLPRLRTVPARLVAPLFFFCAVFLFATLVPFDLFYSTRSANVTAHIGAITVPPSVVQQIQEAAGLSNKYSDKLYLRVVAIVPWFAFLFAITSGVLMLLSQSRERRTAGKL
ncbi:hypothetical protein BD626DRAFT_58016 [Schizophyllum amplum]|uniref:Actin cortical patch SUR7/pH-response regulator pali n=1 Tax=Schizophyllum amplum TaxID=97359 RepID=A0A550CBL5_9AGAR|nr:hypothetical protein BD626DRAFT_58016 [Auriculariopsis ampla]